MFRTSHLIAAWIGFAMLAPAAHGVEPGAKCESGKLKVVGQYAGCRLKAHAVAVSKELATDFSKCDEKFTQKYTKLEATAGSGVCPTEADETSIRSRVGNDVDQVAVILSGGDLPGCGDGAVGGSESCDGADLDGQSCADFGFAGGTLACTTSCAWDLSACTTPSCGNGTVDGGEECDWGALDGETCLSLGYSATGELGCVPTACTFDLGECRRKIVFVTSTTHTGNLGGLAGADNICQSRALAAGLAGTFRAWLSNSITDASSRLSPSQFGYELIDGTKIADDLADLLDGSLDSPISLNENGVPVVTNPWTGTSSTGAAYSADCQGFTSTAGSGAIGASDQASSAWTFAGTAACVASHPLYCFEL